MIPNPTVLTITKAATARWSLFLLQQGRGTRLLSSSRWCSRDICSGPHIIQRRIVQNIDRNSCFFASILVDIEDCMSHMYWAYQDPMTFHDVSRLLLDPWLSCTALFFYMSRSRTWWEKGKQTVEHSAAASPSGIQSISWSRRRVPYRAFSGLNDWFFWFHDFTDPVLDVSDSIIINQMNNITSHHFASRSLGPQIL